MSVCIAAISKENHIVTITDRKASSDTFSNEDASIKSEWITHRWCALFAGNDISPCDPIIRAARNTLKGKDNSVDTVKAEFEKQYQLYLSHLASSQVLGRWKLSMEDFLATGRANFGDNNFDLLFEHISQVKLSCQFIVCGFDEAVEPHIFSVRNPGYTEERTTPGYWAIGDGAERAMSILGFFKQNVITPLARTYYNVCSAKYMAESVPTVGVASFMDVISPDSTRPKVGMLGSIADIARDGWVAKGGMPAIPSETIEAIKKVLLSE